LTGVLTPTGNGIGLSGIVTSIIAGTNVTISGATGAVTINASGGGGGSIAGISTTGTSHFANLQLTGITTGLNVSGVSTFAGNVSFGSSALFGDNDTINMGDGDDLQIFHSGVTGNIRNTTGTLILQSSTVRIQDAGSSQTAFSAADGVAKLYFANSEKLETTNTGAVVTGILTATSFSGDGSALTGIAVTASSNVQVTWDVTANGSSAYRFAGPGNDASDDNPDLYLVRGQRYRFTNNSGGSHPFQIRSSAGGSAYSTGVTNNGASSGNIDFNVQHDAPARLYYQCTSHSGMVGNIYITGGGQWQNTSVAASGTPEIYTDYAVGIGTDNPINPFHVLTSSTDVAKFESTSAGAGVALTLDHNSASPADDDNIGKIVFNGRNDANESTTYADIKAITTDVSDSSEDCALTFNTRGAGSFAERLRITSGGNVNIGGDFGQTDSKVTIVDVSRPIAEATLNLQSSTTSGAADTGPVLRFYGHSGSEGRYHASIKGAKENGTSGNTAGYLAFNTRPAGGAMAEAARFNSSGNLVFPSGQGIDFSATGNSSGTTGSEVFDDYEEGTFTIGFTQSGATITANSSYNTMNYTKVGRICHIFGHIRVNTVSGSGSGNIKVTGLPFSIISGVNQGRGGLHVTYLDLSATSSESLKSAPFQFDEGTTNLELECARFTSISQYGNGDELMISATYLVA
jgi:hypothetical protein